MSIKVFSIAIFQIYGFVSLFKTKLYYVLSIQYLTDNVDCDFVIFASPRQLTLCICI